MEKGRIKVSLGSPVNSTGEPGFSGKISRKVERLQQISSNNVCYCPFVEEKQIVRNESVAPAEFHAGQKGHGALSSLGRLASSPAQDVAVPEIASPAAVQNPSALLRNQGSLALGTYISLQTMYFSSQFSSQVVFKRQHARDTGILWLEQ